jgi:hypothetical protein
VSTNGMKTTLEYRAAEYVGRENLPRRSVRLSTTAVLVVWNDPNVSALIYDEDRPRPVGQTFMLTPKRRADLAALFATEPPQTPEEACVADGGHFWNPEVGSIQCGRCGHTYVAPKGQKHD